VARIIPIIILVIGTGLLAAIVHALFTGAKRNWSRGSWIVLIFAVLAIVIIIYSAFQGT